MYGRSLFKHDQSCFVVANTNRLKKKMDIHGLGLFLNGMPQTKLAIKGRTYTSPTKTRGVEQSTSTRPATPAPPWRIDPYRSIVIPRRCPERAARPQADQREHPARSADPRRLLPAARPARLARGLLHHHERTARPEGSTAARRFPRRRCPARAIGRRAAGRPGRAASPAVPCAGCVRDSAAPSRFGRIAAAGLITTIFFYMAINLLMVMGLAPVVGIPLPLVSYGGSAMMTVLICLGLLMAIDRHGRRRR